MGGNKNMFDDVTPEIVAPIPIDELYSSFDHESMWKIKKIRMRKPKEECGCYSTEKEHEREYCASSFSTTRHLCPDHYAKHLVEKEQYRQYENEKLKNLKNCTDVIFFLAKENQEVMTNAIKNLTLPFLKDLNEFCAKNNFTYKQLLKDPSSGLIKCISSNGSATFASEDHTCTCRWVVTFEKIKYKKVAKKTFQFDIPDEDDEGNIGSITIRHCSCHHDQWRLGIPHVHGLKPLVK